jgi:hypothetical protein
MRVDFGPSDGGVLTLASVVERARDARDRTGCDVQTEGARARVRLWGALPFTWCGNLSLHCHGASVSILEVDARHLGNARWAASLLVESLSSAKAVRALDFVAMARRRPSLAPLPPTFGVDHFRLVPPDEQGVVRVYLTAPDRLGLLAAILETIVACGLRPRELSVRTRAGRAEDWLALEAQVGSRPSASALAALADAFARRRSLDP